MRKMILQVTNVRFFFIRNFDLRICQIAEKMFPFSFETKSCIFLLSLQKYQNAYD